MFRNTTNSSETFGFDTNFEHYFSSQPYKQPERIYEVLGQGPEHPETQLPGMHIRNRFRGNTLTKSLLMGENGKIEEEPKDSGYSALLIHKEQWDLLNNHTKMLATPRYQTSIEIGKETKLQDPLDPKSMMNMKLSAKIEIKEINTDPTNI